MKKYLLVLVSLLSLMLFACVNTGNKLEEELPNPAKLTRFQRSGDPTRPGIRPLSMSNINVDGQTFVGDVVYIDVNYSSGSITSTFRELRLKSSLNEDEVIILTDSATNDGYSLRVNKNVINSATEEYIVEMTIRLPALEIEGEVTYTLLDIILHDQIIVPEDFITITDNKVTVMYKALPVIEPPRPLIDETTDKGAYEIIAREYFRDEPIYIEYYIKDLSEILEVEIIDTYNGHPVDIISINISEEALLNIRRLTFKVNLTVLDNVNSFTWYLSDHLKYNILLVGSIDHPYTDIVNLYERMKVIDQNVWDMSLLDFTDYFNKLVNDGLLHTSYEQTKNPLSLRGFYFSIY